MFCIDSHTAIIFILFTHVVIQERWKEQMNKRTNEKNKIGVDPHCVAEPEALREPVAPKRGSDINRRGFILVG